LIVLRLHCRKESATRIFGGGKGLLSRTAGRTLVQTNTEGECEQNGRNDSMKALAFKLSKN